jgi:glutathione synthase/RimK-type ligase-like ATP-grasp enzyme
MMPAALLVTCADLPSGDEDADLLLTALERRGVEAQWVIWDDPAVHWGSALAVVRSTWDYTMRRGAFLRWAKAVPGLANPADVIAWNSDKTYLRDLAGAGVPIVPTSWAAPGAAVQLPGLGEFVVKPSVGAGSRGAGRFTPDRLTAAQEHVQQLHAQGCTVMTQPYLSDVDSAGETALIYFGGEFSHAIRKGPMLPEGVVHPHLSHALYVEEVITPREPSEAELAVGSKAISAMRERWGRDQLYARVDLLPSPDGPVVVELELTEPSLFLAHSAGAPDRFAAAIAELA